jgi:hypothetical protein
VPVPIFHPAAGQAARGSGALPAFVDILIEMYWYGKPGDGDRRRRLRAYSRQDETPRHLTIELSADGTDYLVHADVDDDDFRANWQGVELVPSEAVNKLTRNEILAKWPDDFDKPDKSTLWRWLELAVRRGLVRQEGSGKKADPFRYWMPGREEMLRPDVGASAEEMHLSPFPK